MSTPDRGRPRGRPPSGRNRGREGQREGQNRGQSSNSSHNYGYQQQQAMQPPSIERTVALLGDFASYTRMQQNPFQREDILSSKNQGEASSSKVTNKEASSSKSGSKASYKDAATDEVIETDYIRKIYSELVIYIDEDDMRNDPISIQRRYLDTRGYPGLVGKSRPVLEQLLVLTGSVAFQHNYQNNNPNNPIGYSKVHIIRIYSERDWGINPNMPKALKDRENQLIYFNYWDYIEAFTLMFYYQNPKAKHSWFFSIDPKVVTRPVPNWFYKWWSKFGPTLEILPDEIANLYDNWVDTSPLTYKLTPSKIIEGQCIMMFFTNFQIPWIWKWQFETGYDNLSIPALKRIFLIKWWRNFLKEDQVKLYTNIKKETYSNCLLRPMPKKKQLSPEELLNHYSKVNPTASQEELMIKILDHQKKQFLDLYDNNTDEDMRSVSSSNSRNNFQAGESQMDPTIEDYWDSMIEGLHQRMKQQSQTLSLPDSSKGKEKEEQ